MPLRMNWKSWVGQGQGPVQSGSLQSRLPGQAPHKCLLSPHSHPTQSLIPTVRARGAQVPVSSRAVLGVAPQKLGPGQV